MEDMYRGEYVVTEEQVRFYEENGYVQLADVLGAEEIATLRECAGYGGGRPQNVCRRTGGPGWMKGTPRSSCKW